MLESHVAFVHYDSRFSFIYIIIFNFNPTARGGTPAGHCIPAFAGMTRGGVGPDTRE